MRGIVLQTPSSARPLSWIALRVYKHFIEVLCLMAPLEGNLYCLVDND